MRSVVGDSESDMSACDDDVSEHDRSLTKAMTSMSIDKSAKSFVALSHFCELLLYELFSW